MAGIEEIAKNAGVSPATVSRALRNLNNVSPLTKQKVFDAAQKLHHHIPTSNDGKPKRTGTVGIVSPFISRWYFSKVISGVERALRELELDLLLYNFSQINSREHIFRDQLIKDRVDALIIISLPPTEEEFKAVLGLDIPVALVGMHRNECSSVSIDDVQGMKKATQHLVDLGHKNFGLLSGDLTNPLQFKVTDERREGFLSVLKANGIEFDESNEVFGSFTMAQGAAAVEPLLKKKNRPTAIVCGSDEMAFGAMKTIKDAGLRIPEDIALIGFDGTELSEFADLSTVSQPAALLGEMAAWLILEKMNKPETQLKSLTLPTELIVRKSSGSLLNGA